MTLLTKSRMSLKTGSRMHRFISSSPISRQPSLFQRLSQAVMSRLGSKPVISPLLPGARLDWSQAISSAEKLVHHSTSSASSATIINPKELLGKDLSLLTDNIKRLLGSGHPVLNTLSSYYFSQQGKHIRPLLVLLISQASSLAPKTPSFKRDIIDEVDTPMSSSSSASFLPTARFSDSSVSFMPPISENIESTAVSRYQSGSQELVILPSQRRLAEITEMIHTASLLHDDVIDIAMTRRNSPSANAEFGNKMAILAGDFLLARASVALARLRNLEVVELLATVISNLVEGEFMQLRNRALDDKMKSQRGWFPSEYRVSEQHQSQFDYYMEKTYMKTASLIAKSCRAATVLGGCTPEVGDMAYLYGRNIGLAFQLVDDMLDFVVTADEFGKPVNADLKLGLATAPVLYAAEQFPELYPLMERKFEGPGDVELALKLVHESNGLDRTRELAQYFCQEAVHAISALPTSVAKTALIQLTNAVLTRKK